MSYDREDAEDANEDTWLLSGALTRRRHLTPFGSSATRSSSAAYQPQVGCVQGPPQSTGLLLPVDCWVLVVSYIVRGCPTVKKPLEIAEVFQVLQLAHIDKLLRTCTIHVLLDPDAGSPREGMLCISVSDEDGEHQELAEHCLMRPVKAKAARHLSSRAKDAGTAALHVFILVWQFVYISLFLPTTLTLLGLVQPTWQLWTVSAAAVCFIPLFYLGALTSHATMEWWSSINPVALCPHVNRRRAAHCLHPTPWLRIAIIIMATVLVSVVIFYLSLKLGLWLDTRSVQETHYIFIFIIVVCYCP